MTFLHHAPAARAAGAAVTVFALLLLMAGGCGKKDETGSAASGAAPVTAPEVQSQITAQQKAESAERAAHAPPGPK